MNGYEVYAYLDPRIYSNYVLGSIDVIHPPVYIGRGKIKNRRKFIHLTRSSNRRLRNLINILHESGVDPIVITIHDDVTFEESVSLEMKYISMIGRADLNMGPLYNFTDGGEGTRGNTYFKKMTTAELLAHGRKSLAGRTPEGEITKRVKFRQHVDSLTPERKREIEGRRRAGWDVTYFNRSINDRAVTSSRCAEASLRKSQFYVTLRCVEDDTSYSMFMIEWMQSGLAKDGIMDKIRANDFINPFRSRKNKNHYIVSSAIKRKPTETELPALLAASQYMQALP